MKQYLPEILEFLESAEEFRPAFKKGIEALKSFGPELAELLTGIFDYSVDSRARMIRRLQTKHAFSLEDAIFITSDMLSQIARLNHKMKKR